VRYDALVVKEAAMPQSWYVRYVPQTHNMTCWAACIAMLVNFRDSTQYTDNDIVRESGLDAEHGCNDDQYPALLQHFRLSPVAGACMTPDAWQQLLDRGPAIVGLTDHVVVANSTNAESDPAAAQVYIHDPDPSSGESWWTFDRLESAFELRAGREIHMIQA
jgi:ABC-type bacteriocin/lantibiotic exporter with double-glycine peptidase domain